MREYRSASQILFGFLPEQTVDLNGRVWRVREWINAHHESIDQSSLRRAILRAVGPWSAAGRDGGYAERLREGRDVDVLSLNLHDGVSVVPFPEVWICKGCGRWSDSAERRCSCGTGRSKGQLHFVGYCESCGAVRAPWIPPCPVHHELRVVFPGSSSARDIRFDCPVCARVIRRGFGIPRCQCGAGSVLFNVHRSSSVFTPRSVVLVNASSSEQVRALSTAGGASRALSWVLDGLQTRTVRDVGLTRDGLVAMLVAQGISENQSQTMASAAAAAGELASEGGAGFEIVPQVRDEAETQAATIALALGESRILVDDTLGSADAQAYLERSRTAIEEAGLEAVELTDAFHVLTGMFGYTRGNAEPGSTRLVPYRDRRGRYVVYSELGVTEALFFRLRPSAVAEWLSRRGVAIEQWEDERSARIAILNSDAHGHLLSLVHSYAHRALRTLSVHSGIDRDALSELLVPLHLGFFVYAAARGEFVLGGLQAVFENGLPPFFDDLLGDHRCPLDPGCERHGAACVACLHIGETSCRHFNSQLDRRVLDGPGVGFLKEGARQGPTATWRTGATPISAT